MIRLEVQTKIGKSEKYKALTPEQQAETIIVLNEFIDKLDYKTIALHRKKWEKALKKRLKEI